MRRAVSEDLRLHACPVEWFGTAGIAGIARSGSKFFGDG
jgi:hypothetical protein